MKRQGVVVCLLGLLTWGVFLSSSAQAQWTTQTVSLAPGWNAVHLEVQPDISDADVVLNGLPIESVWRWNRRFSSVQYIQDPATLVMDQPDWLIYLPPTHEFRSQQTLHTIDGGQAYLIKVNDGAVAFDWNLRGRPVLRKPQWLSDSLNFVGFEVNPNTPPKFSEFFGASPAHRDGPFYRLGVDGSWSEVTSPFITPMRSGEAFWVRCNGQSDFAGPVVATVEQAGGLDYGRALVEQTLRIKNDALQGRTISIGLTASEPPPPGTTQELTGEVVLYYWRYNPATQERGWVELTGPLSLALGAGQEWPLRFEIRRAEMDPAPTGAALPLYAGLLEVTDGLSRVTVPVSAIGMSQASAAMAQGGIRPLDNSAGGPYAGLWVGYAAVNQVSQPSAADPDGLKPTASDFQFRLLIHVDQAGQARLLQKVLQMWKPGTTKPDPQDPAVSIIDVPGRFVLVTDESLTTGLTGALLRDGIPVARRFSSAAFGFSDPVAMSPADAFGQGTLSCAVDLHYNDTLNPFKHAYHPDHNNLDERHEELLEEGLESFTVAREIELEFAVSDPDGLALAGWGDTEVGGTYRETITGLHKVDLHAGGTFRLHRASRISVLDDGAATMTAGPARQ